MTRAEGSGFHPGLLLEGLSVTAIRICKDMRVVEVVGQSPLPLSPGSDVREAIPALIGMEEELQTPQPEVALPFVSFGTGTVGGAPGHCALRVHRDSASQALWILLRTADTEAEVQQELVQKHNTLALAQSELVRARDAAREADRAKARFLGNVSHELRTPLHVVIGNASLLGKPRKRPLEPWEVAELAGDIRESGELLLQLVEDLIDISRSETGSLALYEEWFDLCELMERVVGLGRDLPDAQQIEFHVEMPDAFPAFFADSRRIKQILLNLISNAVKAVASDGGRVEVALTPTPSGGARMIVADTGPGMSAEQLAIARQPFGQPDARVRSKGSGLGLAIVDSLASLHRAEFHIDTAPGRGLRASVEFGPERLASDAMRRS